MQPPAPFALPRALGGSLAAAALLASLPADAVRLGELKVHSAVGEALDASFSLKVTAGEALGPECFRLGSARATRLLLDSRATFAIDAARGAPRLRMRTAVPITEPVLLVRISAACPGGRATTRDYELLLEPRTPAARAVTQAPAAAGLPPSAESPPPPPAPGFSALAGDSLASIAAAIYPKDRAAREAYLQALLRENAAVASRGADEPIPAGTTLVLPDLHEFAKTLPPRKVAAAPRRVAAPQPGKRPVPAQPPAPKADSPAGAHTPPAAARTPPAAPRAPAGAPFMLRLSSPELDLSRSKNIDERTRAQLRERRLALDADDKVAALLALKHNLRQLEGRIAELQLKLSALPETAPKQAVPPPAPVPPSPAAATPAKPPMPAPAAVAPVPVPPAPKVAAPAAPPATPTPPKSPEKAAAPSPAKALPAAEPGLLDDIPAWIWGLLAVLVASIAAIAWLKLRRRPAPQPAAPAAPPPVSELDEAEALMRGAESAEPVPLHADEGRAVAESDAGLVTRVGGTDPSLLRRRYIEERFPEIAGGTIVLDDPDSVVKGARLFYEDGALPRAVELLQFAVEERPASMKPWLALFEIFRLEGLAGEFGALAARFREHHGATDNWQKVQFIGRELDPQNPLYHDAPQTHLETIGPLAAAKLTPVTFDPLSENWLNAPMDFTSAALASTLRAALLADAGVKESDLAQDPMPALKNIEMFDVA